MTKAQLLEEYNRLQLRGEPDAKTEVARLKKLATIRKELADDYGLKDDKAFDAALSEVVDPAAKEEPAISAPAKTDPVTTASRPQTTATPPKSAPVDANGDGTISHEERMAMRAGIKQEKDLDIPKKPDAAADDDRPRNKDGTPMTQQQMNDALADAAVKGGEAKAIRDKETAAKKTAPQDKDKELWSKWHEAKAKREAANGGVVPEGWFSSASKNEGGNPATIPKGLEADYRTEFSSTAPRQASGLSSDAAWEKLFPKTVTEGTTRTNAAGVYQERGIGKDGKPGTGNWVDMSRPLGSGDMLNDHFGGKWTDATPEAKASMLRGELGLPPVGQWWTPDMTAGEVGAGLTPVGTAGLPANTIRTASKNGQVVGFATNGPALPAAAPVAPVANANLRLPGIESLFPDVMPGLLPKPKDQL